jgi:hypothetical protein
VRGARDPNADVGRALVRLDREDQRLFAPVLVAEVDRVSGDDGETFALDGGEEYQPAVAEQEIRDREERSHREKR